MSRDLFTFESITLKTVEPSDIAEMQNILNRASYYHTTILQQSPAGLADRCFRAEVPTVSGSRVFRHLFLGSDARVGISPSFALDVFVGFPNYKIASVALFVIREDRQRKGTGREVLSQTLAQYLIEYHPAVETISVSLTENNVPALRCLVASGYERTNRWEKLDINGRPIIALTYRRSVRDNRTSG